MSITNEPKIKNPLIKAVREQLEHRALWLYLLCDEAGKRGLEWEDFGSAATKRLVSFRERDWSKRAIRKA